MNPDKIKENILTDILLQKYNSIIMFYSKKIDMDNYEDHMQNIKLYVINNIYRYNCLIGVTLDFYVKMLIKTSYRKIIFDKTKQTVFEESFYRLKGQHSYSPSYDNYEDIMKDVTCRLTKESQKRVFYSILYDTNNSNFMMLSNKLGMKYSTFMSSVRYIRKTLSSVLEEYS